ncbi:MAG: hypothetical protein AAFQ65_01695 [Myxococcota bacterium]
MIAKHLASHGKQTKSRGRRVATTTFLGTPTSGDDTGSMVLPTRCFAVVLLLLSVRVHAADASAPNDPEKIALGVDIELSAAEVELRVNDVPVLDPAQNLGGESQLTTQLRLNTAFRKGNNRVTIRIRLLPKGSLGYAPKARLDFGHWALPSQPFVFDGRPMAASITVVEKNGEQVLESRLDAQPLVQAEPVSRVTKTKPSATSWQSYAFYVNVGLELPRMPWTSGAVLRESPALRDALTQEMRRVHRQLGADAAAAYRVLQRSIERRAKAVGTRGEEMFRYSLKSTFDGSDGYALVPFAIEEAELRIFGDGRLVTFVPSPHRFYNAQTQTNRNFVLYYWKDKSGAWHVTH